MPRVTHGVAGKGIGASASASECYDDFLNGNSGAAELIRPYRNIL